MQISLDELRELLKSTGIPTYRDSAPTGTPYPYIEYEFVNEQYRRGSNKVLYDLPLYQIAVVTQGTEVDLELLKKALNDRAVYYAPFVGGRYDENDDTITQYITFVRCLHVR